MVRKPSAGGALVLGLGLVATFGHLVYPIPSRGTHAKACRRRRAGAGPLAGSDGRDSSFSRERSDRGEARERARQRLCWPADGDRRGGGRGNCGRSRALGSPCHLAGRAAWESSRLEPRPRDSHRRGPCLYRRQQPARARGARSTRPLVFGPVRGSCRGREAGPGIRRRRPLLALRELVETTRVTDRNDDRAGWRTRSRPRVGVSRAPR